MSSSTWPTLTYWMRVTAVILLMLLLAYFIFLARGVLLLIGLSFLLAVGLEPLVQKAQKRVSRRGYAVSLVWVAIVLVGAGVLLAALIPAVNQLSTLTEKLPRELRALSDTLQDHNSALGKFFERDDVQETLHSAAKNAPEALSHSANLLIGFLGGLASGIASLMVVAVLTIYFMLALPRILDKIYALLGTKRRAATLHEALGKIGGYITGQMSVSLCAGIASFIVFISLSVPYAALLAMIVAITDAIPQVGAALGSAIGVLFALTVSLPAALIALVFFIVYQTFENYILSPHIMGHAIQLSPLAALLAVLIGSSVLGVVGAIVALPVTAAVHVIVKARPTPQGSGSPQT